jgi:hypothetical protein
MAARSGEVMAFIDIPNSGGDGLGRKQAAGESVLLATETSLRDLVLGVVAFRY